MITPSFVCWKWGATYTAEHVNTLHSMVARNYPAPHTFACVTNDATGIDPRVTIIPDAEDFAAVPSPHGRGAVSCYRRLALFHPDAAATIGPRIVSLDLDCVITGDLRPLVDRPEDFIAWRDPLHRQYNGSLVILTAGARPQVWERFDPGRSPQEALATGLKGSDQGWISHCLPREATVGREDGVYSYKWDKVRGGALPANARMVFFTGEPKPWAEAGVEWIREHYHP